MIVRESYRMRIIVKIGDVAIAANGGATEGRRGRKRETRGCCRSLMYSQFRLIVTNQTTQIYVLLSPDLSSRPRYARDIQLK